MTQPGNSHGGYRPPAHPAPVSGPGAASRRTDGQPQQQLPDAAYGEQKTFQEIQAGAPMGAPPPSGPGGLPITPIDTSGSTGMAAPSEHPDEPVTAGADAGPGPGMGSLRAAPVDPSVQYMKQILPTLSLFASMPYASREVRQMVRRIRAS